MGNGPSSVVGAGLVVLVVVGGLVDVGLGFVVSGPTAGYGVGA